MAPHLAAAQRRLISDILMESTCGCDQIAHAAECRRATVRHIRENLRMFGSATAPRSRGGRQRTINPAVITSLQNYLLDRPGSYLDEMAVFLWDEFATTVHVSTISRTLSRLRWTKKVIRRRAKEQSRDLRDLYLYTGWSPSGVAPVEVTRFHHGDRYRILPAYTQEVLSYRGFSEGQLTASFRGLHRGTTEIVHAIPGTPVSHHHG